MRKISVFLAFAILAATIPRCALASTKGHKTTRDVLTGVAVLAGIGAIVANNDYHKSQRQDRDRWYGGYSDRNYHDRGFRDYRERDCREYRGRDYRNYRDSRGYYDRQDYRTCGNYSDRGYREYRDDRYYDNPYYRSYGQDRYYDRGYDGYDRRVMESRYNYEHHGSGYQPYYDNREYYQSYNRDYYPQYANTGYAPCNAYPPPERVVYVYVPQPPPSEYYAYRY